ncbi:MAG: hypothetical protein IJ809_06570 [Clostridia bacterium]|nr:hypothetical protein [Clostridia bacterium]
MSEMQKQNIIDVNSIMCNISSDETKIIKEFAEKFIDVKLLALAPDAILENMDITEKLMLLSYISKSEEERKKDEEEAIPLEYILKEEMSKNNALYD